MQLLGAEHPLFADHILGRVEHDFVERDIVAIPVQIALLHNDAAIKRPLGQFECPVAHDVGDPGPGCVPVCHLAELKQRFRVHGKGAVVIHQLDEVGRGRIERDFEGGVVECFHTHLVEVGDLALEVGLGVHHREQHVGILITRFRMQGPMPTPHVISRSHLVAVGPFRVRVEVKGNDPTFIAELPALGHARLGLQRDGIFDCQALEQSSDDVILRYAGHHVGIETLRLSAVAIMQYAVAVTRDNVALSAPAGCD